MIVASPGHQGHPEREGGRVEMTEGKLDSYALV